MTDPVVIQMYNNNKNYLIKKIKLRQKANKMHSRNNKI